MLHKQNMIQEWTTLTIPFIPFHMLVIFFVCILYKINFKKNLQHSTQKDSEWQHLQQWGPWKEKKKKECKCIVDLPS